MRQLFEQAELDVVKHGGFAMTFTEHVALLKTHLHGRQKKESLGSVKMTPPIAVVPVNAAGCWHDSLFAQTESVQLAFPLRFLR